MAHNLTVIIPTSGRPKLVHRTLESLAHCRRPAIYRETIVVENGSRKEAEQIARAFEENLNLRYLYLPIGNKSNALNAALQMVESGLIFFADDDVRFDQGVLEAYADTAMGKTEGEFYGGPYAADYVNRPPEWLIEFLPNSAVGWSLGDARQYVRKGNLFVGFNWAAFAGDLKRIGGFSLQHGPGSTSRAVGQETEMQTRLFDNGLKGLYIPTAMVWHFVPPERCSPRWAAMRAYRWGIQGGFRYQGPLLALLQRCFKYGIKSLLSMGSQDPRTSFEPYYWFRYTSGMVKGRLVVLRDKK